jgi:hypothetical protein
MRVFFWEMLLAIVPLVNVCAVTQVTELLPPRD